MKLVIKENRQITEPLVSVEYAKLDSEVEAILVALNSLGKELLGKEGTGVRRIPVSEVLYCESVDGATFIYLRDNVIESPFRLSEIEARLRNTSLVRASRTMLVNLDHIASLRPFMGARLQIVMDNGEYLMASRQYAPDIKRRIGIE